MKALQPRSHYQQHNPNIAMGTSKRQAIASLADLDRLKEIEHLAGKARQATTQAAYDLRLSNLKSLVKSL